MDLVSVLDGKLVQLPQGDHTKGLGAVRLHIEAAIGHLRRGQSEGDTGAFTDTIYRCNQAFEGSVKEAYRVLAEKNPEKLTPAKIEAFLSSGSVLRTRVLDQFTNYRTGWRNPSTHDYMLDFDEDEALLAIVSVTVFAVVLCGQIDTKLAADLAKQRAVVPARRVPSTKPLLTEVSDRLVAFAKAYEDTQQGSIMEAYRHLEGSIAGHLAAEFSATEDVVVELGYRVQGREADVAVLRRDELIAVEVKRMARPMASMAYSGISYLTELIRRGLTGGILFLYLAGDKDFSAQEIKISDHETIYVVTGSTMKKVLARLFHGWNPSEAD